MTRRKPVLKCRPCQTCGGVLREAYGWHCQRCDGPRRVMRPRLPTPGRMSNPPELAAWAGALDPARDVTYPLAAATWDCDLPVAMGRVNMMVHAGYLRGVGPGRFEWVSMEREVW